jgi:hypothetical protein
MTEIISGLVLVAMIGAALVFRYMRSGDGSQHGFGWGSSADLDGDGDGGGDGGGD